MEIILISGTNASEKIIVICQWAENNEQKQESFDQDDLKLWGDDTGHTPICLQ